MLFPILYICFATCAYASNTVSLLGQCFHPGISLFATLSCGAGGDEQATFVAHEGLIPSVDVESLSDPWSHEVVCTQSIEAINGPLCIYTCAAFASGRGISLLTTPAIAEKALNLAPFRDADSIADVNKDSSPPWRTANLPGRGTGLLATRELRFGDRITAHTPVLAVLGSVASFIAAPDLEYLLGLAVEQLPQTSQDKLLSLSRNLESDEYRIQDIMQTNAFEVQIGGEMHLVIYPEASRINHDCGPKCALPLPAFPYCAGTC